MPVVTSSGASESAGSVVDLFCGAGGLSYGFKEEAFHIAAGIDTDEACRFPFEENLEALFLLQDVSSVTAEQIEALFAPGQARILVGCAPCQPFSAYNAKNTDTKWQLLGSFQRIIREVLPDVVSMENVPRLLTYARGTVFRSFIDGLKKDGYGVAWRVLNGADFGLAQVRHRLVLIASRRGIPRLPSPSHAKQQRTLREEVGLLQPLQHGESSNGDRMHCARRLSPVNAKRIAASKPGGTWRDWPLEIRAKCHLRQSGKTYRNVYGRMLWDKPAPTITTQFSGYGNGRFGHPEQDRALTLREGALLQGFPFDYEFVQPGKPVRFGAVSRLIGNAVPVKLSVAIASAVRTHLKESHHA